MPKKKFPKSHETHTYEDISFADLRNNFPRHWKIVKNSDNKSGIEYGQDWLIALADADNEITGPEFRVQSKVTEQPSSKRRIGVRVKVSTINYLHDVPLPVLLHFIDKSEVTPVGYWEWFEDWYANHYAPAMQSKDEIMIYISKKNVLQPKTIRLIEQNARLHQLRAQLIKNSDAATRAHPHYGFRVGVDTNRVEVGMYLKHQQAPLPHFQMILNEDASEILRKALTKREVANFTGKLQWPSDLPDFMLPDEGVTEMEFTVMPFVQMEAFPARIQYFREDNTEPFEEIAYVKLLPIEAANNTLVWEGTISKKAIKFTLVIYREAKKAILRSHYLKNNKDLAALREFFTFRDSIKIGNRTVLTNLEDDARALTFRNSQSLPIVESEEELIWKALVTALFRIQAKTDYRFSVPSRYSLEDLFWAETIAEVVNTGHTKQRIGLLSQISDDGKATFTVDVRTIKLASKEVKEIGFAILFHDTNFPIITLFDYNIDLGSCRYVFNKAAIENINEIQDEIASSEASDDMLVNVPIIIDWNETGIFFKRWYGGDIEAEMSTPE